MSRAQNRVAVLHGVNFDVLERRDPALYGGIRPLRAGVRRSAAGRASSGSRPASSRPTPKPEFCEPCTVFPPAPTAPLINAGAWTHYSRAIGDALAVDPVPTIEVHLSDVENREEWRKLSVFEGLVEDRVFGQGVDGYREALELDGRRSSRE